MQFFCLFLFACLCEQILDFNFYLVWFFLKCSGHQFKYTLLGVHNEYHQISFENIRKDVKIRIFAILITYCSGFRIFKQNQENPEEI